MGRNHNNAYINNLQDSGRKKSLKGTIDRKEVRKLVKLLKQSERVLYAIDQDYGKDNADLSHFFGVECYTCLLYTSPSPRDLSTSRMPSSA